VIRVVCWQGAARGFISDCFSGFKFVCTELEKAERKIRRKLVWENQKSWVPSA